MTASSLLSKIAFPGARGLDREALISAHGIGVIDLCEHLQQLRLVYFNDLPYTSNPRYVASIERGGYPYINTLGVFQPERRMA